MDDHPLPPYATDDRRRVLRRNALRVMVIAGPLTAVNATVAAFAGSWLREGPLDFLIGPWLPYVAALPALPFLAAALVYVTGRPFDELAAAWSALSGWQRGVLGVLVVLLSAAVILGGVVLALARVAPANR